MIPPRQPTATGNEVASAVRGTGVASVLLGTQSPLAYVRAVHSRSHGPQEPHAAGVASVLLGTQSPLAYVRVAHSRFHGPQEPHAEGASPKTEARHRVGAGLRQWTICWGCLGGTPEPRLLSESALKPRRYERGREVWAGRASAGPGAGQGQVHRNKNTRAHPPFLNHRRCILRTGRLVVHCSNEKPAIPAKPEYALDITRSGTLAVEIAPKSHCGTASQGASGNC